jgi:hypothetical protein
MLFPVAEKQVGRLGRTLALAPGEEGTLRYVVAWYFPNLQHIPKVAIQGRYYAARFSSAREVFGH